MHLIFESILDTEEQILGFGKISKPTYIKNIRLKVESKVRLAGVVIIWDCHKTDLSLNLRQRGIS